MILIYVIPEIAKCIYFEFFKIYIKFFYIENVCVYF